MRPFRRVSLPAANSPVNERPVTRPLLTVTPSQSPTAVETLQFREAVPRSSSLASSSSSQSATREALADGLRTAPPVLHAETGVARAQMPRLVPPGPRVRIRKLYCTPLVSPVTVCEVVAALPGTRAQVEPSSVLTS